MIRDQTMPLMRFHLHTLCSAAMSACVAMSLPSGVARAAEGQAPAVKAGPLTILSPWARATPKGATTAAAYLTIQNAGDASDSLTGISTVVAGRASPHEMTMTDGVMAMRPLPDVVVPAHGTVTFKPGAMHIMLEQVTAPLKPGATFVATLTFAHAGAVPVTFAIAPIGASGPRAPMHDMPMNGESMD